MKIKREITHVQLAFCVLSMIITPLIVLYWMVSAFYCESDILGGMSCVLSNLDIVQFYDNKPAYGIVICWLVLQLALYFSPDIIHKISGVSQNNPGDFWDIMLPGYRGGIQYGAVSPGGYVYWYNINGLQAWIISNILFVAGAYWEYFPATIIYDNWLKILVFATKLSFAVALIVYIKGCSGTWYKRDQKFSSSRLYDFFIGTELNPRIAFFDFKLFFNGRPGIIGWSLINMSFAAAQYQKHGFISNSMVIVLFLQTLYIGYFFYRETWYLKTLDISLDHFGWLFAFGDLVWLPAMYTLQGLYLVHNPVQLSWNAVIAVMGLGCAGFIMFATSNNQKDLFKVLGADMKIEGEPVEFMVCPYKTSDNTIYESKLLLSGWWGMCRHANYTGDLMLSLAYSQACGTEHIFPYFYIIFLTILLLHRTMRDEAKCAEKYGDNWTNYCKRVPYRFIPYVF
jgi:7-dehydrocholesterol reductase